MNKKDLSERDICSKFIGPAVKRAGWDGMMQIREEVAFTKGPHHRPRASSSPAARPSAPITSFITSPTSPSPSSRPRTTTTASATACSRPSTTPRRSTSRLCFPPTATALSFTTAPGISAEKEATPHARRLPVAQATSGQNTAPGKDSRRTRKQIVLQDYFDDGSGKAPRYYQSNAINAAIEAIAKGQNRILLVMATGTGKTYTAFQIIWRLWKAGRKKRILFLADRNVLVDQTMVNDFRPFGAAMAKLSTGAKTIEREDGTEVELTTALDKKRRIDTAYEVYLGLYQAITGPEERQKLFREFSPGFFDLIVIDECHRGSAADDAAWREILEYFSAATQIGLTATPKETEYVSNIHYFGKPVYTYSLKQGIEDGFLAPYKVIKVHIDVDVAGLPAGEGRHGPRRQ